MSLINVTGVTGVDSLPTPSDYQPDIEILENSDRNTQGMLLRDIIAEKIKVNLKWKYMTQADYKKLQLIRRAKSFTCSYWDTGTETMRSITAYSGQPKGTPVSCDENGVTAWKDISVSFIEY